MKSDNLAQLVTSVEGHVNYSIEFITTPLSGVSQRSRWAGLVMSNHTPRNVTWDSSADCEAVPQYFHNIVGVLVSLVAVVSVVGNCLVLYTFAT